MIVGVAQRSSARLMIKSVGSNPDKSSSFSLYCGQHNLFSVQKLDASLGQNKFSENIRAKRNKTSPNPIHWIQSAIDFIIVQQPSEGCKIVFLEILLGRILTF